MKNLFIIVCLTGISGCSNIDYSRSAGLASTRNVERTFVIDYGDGEKGTLLSRCLEAPGPATALQNLTVKAQLSGDASKITNGSAKLDVTDNESFHKLYEVTSVLQYAHAMTYRLCEAGLNRHIEGSKYMEQFDKIMQSTENLLSKQLELSKQKTEQLKVKATILKERIKHNRK